MKKADLKKSIKKTAAALAGVILTVLFLLLLTGFGQTAPENPMEEGQADASRMYLTSSTLAMDEELLAGVENANISSGGDGGTAQQETQEQQPEEETDQQVQTQETRQGAQTTEVDSQNQNPDETSEETDSSDQTQAGINKSLLSLIQKNESGGTGGQPSGGGGSGENPGDGGSGTTPGGDSGRIPADGGQQSTLNPSASEELFITSIRDGDEVTDPEYPFTITLTEKGKQLTLVSMTVTLNGSGRRCSMEDSLTLREGANQIVVTLRFRDHKYNQIDAPSKAYTVYYVPENGILLQVRNAKTGETIYDGDTLTVYEDNIWIEVTAKQATAQGMRDVSSRVRLWGRTQTADSDGIYRMKLSVGDQNVLKVVAGEGGNNQASLTCTIRYKLDNFSLSFESDAVTEKVSGYRFGGYTEAQYTAASEKFRFRVSCSVNTGLEKITSVKATNRYGSTELLPNMGADGSITYSLDTSSQGNAIRVTCMDSDGEEKYYTWYIYFRRQADEEENQKKAPVIMASLTNEVVHRNPYVLPVVVYDWQGNTLSPSNFKVYLNGEELNFDSISGGAYEYNLYLTEGQNHVLIYAEDNNQYTAKKELTVTFTPEKESAQIHVIVSAEVVGLGTLIDEYITTMSDVTVAEIVEERLAAYGYSTVHDGTATGNNYYLRHIQKPGMMNGWSISEEERSLLEMEGYSIDENLVGTDSLGERDFTAGSGWMITLNHYFIGQTMGTRAVRDGDEIHLIYTLDVGNDIGVDPDSGIYG